METAPDNIRSRLVSIQFPLKLRVSTPRVWSPPTYRRVSIERWKTAVVGKCSEEDFFSNGFVGPPVGIMRPTTCTAFRKERSVALFGISASRPPVMAFVKGDNRMAWDLFWKRRDLNPGWSARFVDPTKSGLRLFSYEILSLTTMAMVVNFYRRGSFDYYQLINCINYFIILQFVYDWKRKKDFNSNNSHQSILLINYWLKTWKILKKEKRLW